MPLSNLLWVFLVFTFNGRDASKHRCACSGWKDCTQASGASQGPGEERKTGEKSLRISVCFLGLWSEMRLIPTLFYILLHLCFLIFSTGSGIAEKATQDQPDIFTQIAEAITMNCRCETIWSSYNIFFWYKQPPSGEMIFLTRDGHYSLNFQRSLKSSSLTISTLQLEDSAKYFCALFEPTVLKVIGKAE